MSNFWDKHHGTLKSLLVVLVFYFLSMFLPTDLPTDDWVAIPAPEGTKLHCWERRDKVMCHERPDTNRGEVLMGNGNGGVRGA